jgi:microcystin-dependent protein
MTSVIRRDVMLSSHLMPFTGDMKFGFTDFDHIGWLLCDGRTLNVSDYNQLFQIVGYTYGGTVGGATFKLPDMRGRVPGAAGAGALRDDANRLLTNRTKGQHLGEEVHQLTIPEMPSHNHGVAGGGQVSTNNITGISGEHFHSITDNGHTHTYLGVQGQTAGLTGDTVADDINRPVETTGNTKTGIIINPAGNHAHTLNPAGGDQVHNNMQPTLFIGNMFIYCGNFKIGRRRGDYSGQPI